MSADRLTALRDAVQDDPGGRGARTEPVHHHRTGA